MIFEAGSLLELAAVLFEEPVDPFCRGKEIRQGIVVVQVVDDQRDVLAEIGDRIIRALEEFRTKVGKVRRQDLVDVARFVGLVEFLKAVREQAEGRRAEDTAGAAELQLLCHLQHGAAGRDHVVDDQDVLAVQFAAEVLMRDDRVHAVDDVGVIPALVEHADVDV